MDNINELIDEVIACNGNHAQKPGSLSEEDFARRAQAVRVVLSGGNVDAVAAVGYSNIYARNIYNMVQSNGAEIALFQRRGVPRRINLNLTSDVIDSLIYLFNNETGESAKRAGAILEYNAGGAVYPIARKYGLNKTLMYSMLNNVADGKLDKVLAAKYRPVTVVLTADEVRQIESFVEDQYRGQRARYVLELNKGERSSSVLLKKHGVSLGTGDTESLKTSPVAFVENLPVYLSREVSDDLVEEYRKHSSEVGKIVNTESNKGNKAVFISMYAEGLSNSEIARKLGVTRQYVHQIQNIAEKNPKKFMKLLLRKLADSTAPL